MPILIVEDDEGVRQSLSSILRDEGYVVDTVNDGVEALAYLETHGPPELILLDLMMPRMNGAEFRAHLLAKHALAEVPIIVLSARPDVRREARLLGADDYLSKPMSFEELLHVVQNRAVTSRHRL